MKHFFTRGCLKSQNTCRRYRLFRAYNSWLRALSSKKPVLSANFNAKAYLCAAIYAAGFITFIQNTADIY